MILSASDLFCMSQSTINDGTERCHWCASKCNQSQRHDDPPLLPGQRRTQCARIPSSHWQCHGCWMWRRKRVTVRFVGGGYKDGQCAQNHSWYITETDALAIERNDYEPRPFVLSEMSAEALSLTTLEPPLFKAQKEMYEILLNPPLRFSLSFLDGTNKEGNLIQLGIVNDNPKVENTTPLYFTLNNIPHKYTVHELQDVINTGLVDGKEPGVHVLVKFFGKPEKKKNKVGHPTKEAQATKLPGHIVTPTSGTKIRAS